nr:lactoylglutathione lyase [uncultured Rhodopila sp.]
MALVEYRTGMHLHGVCQRPFGPVGYSEKHVFRVGRRPECSDQYEWPGKSTRRCAECADRVVSGLPSVWHGGCEAFSTLFVLGGFSMSIDTIEKPQTASTTLRIAVASKDDIRIDQHFGHADSFLVYDVTASGATPLGRREIAAHAEGEDEDPRQTILRMLADCKVLLVAKIGPNPQEQLAAVGIEASDMLAGKPIDTALTMTFAAKNVDHGDSPVDSSSFRLLHAMLRVTDLDRSLDFYTNQLGMQVLERRDHKKNQFSQAYIGFGDGFGQMTLELVSNWDHEGPYTQGESFGHIAIEVRGITALCDRLSAAGVKMPRPPRAQRHGENIVAFIEDPDGHQIELVQKPAT